MKKWQNTKQNKLNSNSHLLRRPIQLLQQLPQRLPWSNKRCSSAGGLNTSPAGAVTSLILMSILGGIITGSNAYAEPSTLSLSLDSSTVSLDIASLSNSGTFAQSNASTISAWTNNATGYTLKIMSSNVEDYANRKLVDTSDSSNYLTSISDITTANGFSSGQWGYLPSQYYNSATGATITGNATSYLPAPDKAGDILGITNSANSSDNVDEYTIALGAKVDASTKMGTYENNAFVVQLVGNAIPFSVTYVDNVVSGMPIDVIGTADGAVINLSTNAPTRANYTFIGWCDTAPTTDINGIDVCSGITYYPAGSGSTPTTIAVDQQGGNNDHILYAMWSGGEADYCAGSSYDCMQYLPSNLCTTTMSQVIDKRDGEIYNIQRLADGKCWLLDNLRLDLTTVSLATLQNNTNASNQALHYLKNGGGSGQYATNNVVAKTTDGGSWASSYTAPYIATTHKDAVASVRYGSGSGKIGVYYNYCAASAGSYCYSGNSSVNDVAQDVCPVGWRMPTGGSFGEVQTLLTTYNGDYATFTNALSTPLSGYFYGETARQIGAENNSWTYGRYDDAHMYYFFINTSAVVPFRRDSGQGRGDGFTIRCVMNT